MPRSGTTFLQSRLCKQGLVCLGEVNQTIKAIRNDRVKKSAIRPENKWDIEGYEGVKLTKFWLEIKDEIASAATHLDALIFLYDHASKKFEGAIFVDSSKHIGHLKIYEKVPDVDLSVIHVIRDFRGWELSFKSYFKRNDLNIPKFIPLRWLFVNLKLAGYLRKNADRIEVVTVNYDRLIIEEEYDKKFFNYKYSAYENEFHECFGSRHNLESMNNNSVKYDAKWVLKRSPKLLDFIFFKVLRNLTLC